MLIVDDEKLLLDGLYELFLESEGHRLELYKASTAQDALRTMVEKRFDILLTDIKMPKMSGLELGDRVKQSWPACKIIFLTGFDEFDYIHHAIKQGAENYVLKSEGDEAIVEAVRRTITVLDEQQEMGTLIKQAREIQREQIAHHRAIYLSELLDGLLSQTELNQQVMEGLGIRLALDCPIVMAAARMDLMSTMRPPERELMFTALHSVNVRILSPYVKFADVIYNREYYILFLQDRDHHFQTVERLTTFLHGSIETIQQTVEKSTGHTFSYAFTEQAVEWNEVAKQFILLKAYLSRYFDAKQIIVTDKNVQGMVKPDEDEVRGFIEVFHKRANALDTYIESGRKDEVQMILAELASYADWEAINEMRFMELYYAVALRFLSSANKIGLDRDPATAPHLAKLMQPSAISSRKEALEGLRQIVNLFDHYHAAQSSKLRVDVLGKVVQYIDDHVEGDLSVTQLAEQVYLNPDYLSRMFKQSKGITLTEYIAAVKVQKAKEMLADPRVLVQDIARNLGFTSAGYFSRFFKKETGQTPQDFRTT